jgi:rubrerythrin
MVLTKSVFRRSIMSQKNLEEVVSRMIKEEETTISTLSKTIINIQNNVVRLLLQTMVIDSHKHSSMLRVILGILKNPVVENKEVADVVDALRKHRDEEKDMMGSYERIIETVEDRRIKFLLENIITDEKRHHNIMERLVELVKSSEKSDDEWWDFLYRYSRLTH